MRSIDRVRRRQRWQSHLDRAAVVMVTALALIAGTTLLPQAWQQRLLSWGCQGASFGVTDCVARLYEPPTPNIRAVPLCPVDQVLERMVPTVELQVISFPGQGQGQLQRWVERDGTIRLVALPEVPPNGPVDGWDGASEWPTTPLLRGVDLPMSSQWRFAGGEGERDVVAALQQQHALEYQQVSAIAPFLPRDAPGSRAAALEPTGRLTQSSLADLVSLDPGDEASEAVLGSVSLDGTEAALFHDQTRDLVRTSVPASGLTSSGDSVQGVIRWSRLSNGTASELTATLVTGEDPAQAVHLALPLADGDGPTFESWLGTPGGPQLALDLLMAERPPAPDDRFEQLISAAGSVAIEEFSIDQGDYLDLIWQHMSRDRRPFGELPDERLSTLLIRPQPSGSERTVQEIEC